MSPQELAIATGMPLKRCGQLVALSQFQSLDSVGPAAAQDLWALGYRSLRDLIDANPHRMYTQMQQKVGQPLDPCVEDVFRCVVAQVTYPDLPTALRQWWMWANQRGQPSVEVPEPDTSA